jgi:hypothetical protein
MILAPPCILANVSHTHPYIHMGRPINLDKKANITLYKKNRYLDKSFHIFKFLLFHMGNHKKWTPILNTTIKGTEMCLSI